jgi:Sec-independent protein translocase protein TatA
MGKSIRDFKKAMAEAEEIRTTESAKRLPAPSVAESTGTPEAVEAKTA